MSANHNIRDSINTLIANKTQNNIYVCEVVAQDDGSSYDPSTGTIICSSIGSDHVLNITNVNLNPNLCDGLTLIPSVGSIVFVIKNLSDNQYYCIGFSDLDIIQMGASTELNMHSTTHNVIAHNVNITSTATTFNDGSYGGLIKISDLVTKINTLEEDLNNLHYLFTAWTPVPNDGGAALKAQWSVRYYPEIITTKVGDIENPNVTHGKNN